MRRVLGFTMAVMVTALLPMLAFAQSTPEGSPVSGSPVASPDADDIGRTVRWGDWTVTIERAEFAETVAPDWHEPIKARGKFLVVRLTVVNESRTPTYFNDDPRVRDAEGREFSQSYDATYPLLLAEDMEDGWLQPGIPYAQAIVFDVAKDATGFVLLLGSTALDLGL